MWTPADRSEGSLFHSPQEELHFCLLLPQPEAQAETGCLSGTVSWASRKGDLEKPSPSGHMEPGQGAKNGKLPQRTWKWKEMGSPVGLGDESCSRVKGAWQTWWALSSSWSHDLPWSPPTGASQAGLRGPHHPCLATSGTFALAESGLQVVHDDPAPSLAAWIGFEPKLPWVGTDCYIRALSIRKCPGQQGLHINLWRA